MRAMRRVLFALSALAAVGCGFPTYAYRDEGWDASVAELDAGDALPADTYVLADGCAKPNGCGGCNDLGIKGERCEPCGQWTCAGNSVACVAASPRPGGTCGRCGTSAYACTVKGTSECAVPDDRLVYEDAQFKTKTDKLWTLTGSNEVLVSLKTERALTYVDASFALQRVAAGGGVDGTVTFTLYAGTLKDGLVALQTIDVPALTIATTLEFKSFAFAEVAPRPLGTSLSIGLKATSAAWSFNLYGGGPTAFPAAPVDTSWWHRTSGGAWINEPSSDLAHVLRGKACPP